MFRSVLAILLASTLVAGCMKSGEDAQCTYDPCAQVAPASETNAVKSYLGADTANAIRHCSGMYYRIDTEGTGKRPQICNGISVFYKGKFTNGQVFDQTTTTPFSSALTNLITGWKSGIPLIKEGGRIHLYIPPSLAYGSQEIKDANGNVVMPANSILIFEINLVTVY